MHTEMWEHPATQANVATLRGRGAIVLDPAAGRLTGADSGPGRLPEPAELYEAAVRVLARGPRRAAPDLAGRHVLVSAGGTREELDPVRFLGNWSSGRQGYALARTAAARGAEVTLVSANVELPDPAGAKVVRVISARDMRRPRWPPRRGRGRRGHGGRGGRLPARDAGAELEDQEGGRRRAAAVGWPRTPTSCASCRPPRPRPGQVIVGLRGRDRGPAAQRPGQAGRARAATCSW